MATALVALLVLGTVVLTVRDESDRISTAAELHSKLPLGSQERVRRLLGDPTKVETQPHAEVWDYAAPFVGVTNLRITFGERRRVAWFAYSPNEAPRGLP